MIAAKWSRLFPVNNVRHLGPVHTPRVAAPQRALPRGKASMATRGNARCVNGALVIYGRFAPGRSPKSYFRVSEPTVITLELRYWSIVCRAAENWKS